MAGKVRNFNIFDSHYYKVYNWVLWMNVTNIYNTLIFIEKEIEGWEK